MGIQAVGASLTAIAVLTIPIAGVWVFVGRSLGRKQREFTDGARGVQAKSTSLSIRRRRKRQRRRESVNFIVGSKEADNFACLLNSREDQIGKLGRRIAAQEALRAKLGDDTVELTLKPLRSLLESLLSEQAGAVETKSVRATNCSRSCRVTS